MAVKIRLMRLGKIRQPYYRIVVADARTRRSGRAIEAIGKYHPKQEPSYIEVDSERVQYWLGVGAQPTAPVLNILKITGDWQKFTGQAGAEGTLRRAEPKPDKAEVFAKALAEAGDVPTTTATTPKKKSAKKVSDDKAPGDKAPGDKAPGDKAPGDKAPEEASKAEADPEATGTATKAADGQV